MFATASEGRSWLLMELAGPWGQSAFLRSPSILDPGLGRRIVRRAEAAGYRVVAIRRPGRRDATPRWRWFTASARPGDEWLRAGEVSTPQEYLDIPLDGSGGVDHPGPLVAVCVHGRHDQCCAVRGRHVAASIAQADPESTWECSHLGGDRFAATMVVLPLGLCYGRVDAATDPAELVRLATQRRVFPPLLRGRTSLPHAVQAAQHFVRAEHGDDRVDAYAPLAVETVGSNTVVTLSAADRPLRVELAETRSEPLFSMCTAQIPGQVRQFRLVGIGQGPTDR